MDKLTKSARTYLRLVAALPWPPRMASQEYRDAAAYLRALGWEFGVSAVRQRITQLRAQQDGTR